MIETLARQTCLSHVGTREPNLSHDCTSREALASSLIFIELLHGLIHQLDFDF